MDTVEFCPPLNVKLSGVRSSKGVLWLSLVVPTLIVDLESPYLTLVVASIIQCCSLSKTNSHHLILPLVGCSIVHVVDDSCCEVLAIEQIHLQSVTPVAHENAEVFVSISLPELVAKHRGRSKEVEFEIWAILANLYPAQGRVKGREILMHAQRVIYKVASDLDLDWDLPSLCVVFIQGHSQVKFVVTGSRGLSSGGCVCQYESIRK